MHLRVILFHFFIFLFFILQTGIIRFFGCLIKRTDRTVNQTILHEYEDEASLLQMEIFLDEKLIKIEEIFFLKKSKILSSREKLLVLRTTPLTHMGKSAKENQIILTCKR